MKLREFVAKNGKTFTIHQTHEIPSNISNSEAIISENTEFYYAKHRQIDNWSTFVFSVLNNDSEVVAYCMIVCGSKVVVNGRWCCIGGSVVLPEYRGIGIHKELVNFRMDFAKDAGYHYVKAQALIKNDISNSNLAKCGLIYCGDDVTYNTIDGIIFQKQYYKIL